MNLREHLPKELQNPIDIVSQCKHCIPRSRDNSIVETRPQPTRCGSGVCLLALTWPQAPQPKLGARLPTYGVCCSRDHEDCLQRYVQTCTWHVRQGLG